MTYGNKIWLAVLSAFCIGYVLLRFWQLTDSCLWFDEIFSIHAAEHDWRTLFSFVAQDLIHPPLFYVLLKIWILIGGESLFFVRLFPVLFAVAALVPFYYLCRQLKLELPQIAVAFAFFAFNGALVKYSQEVRMYSLLLCLSLFSIWLFLRFLDLGKNIWILTIINVLLVYTHYYGWLVVFAEILTIVILQRIKIAQISTMFGIVFAAYVPWILMILSAARVNSGVGQNIGWIERPNAQVLIKSIANLVEPFYFQQSSVEPFSNLWISLPVIFLIFLAAAFFFANWKNQSENDRRNFFLLLIFVKFPALLVFAASWILPYSIWGTRHLIIIFAPTAILLSFVFCKLEPKPLKYLIAGSLALLFAAALIAHIQKPQPQYIWCAWENLAQKTEPDKPRKIYVFEDLVAYHFWFATRADSQTQIFRVREVPEMIEDKAYFLPRGFSSVQVIDLENIADNNFYVAFRDMNFNEKHPPLNILKAKGYKIGTPKEIDAGGLKAFLVEISR